MGLFKRGTLLYAHEKPFGQILNFPYNLFSLSIAMQVPCVQTAAGRATAPGFPFHHPSTDYLLGLTDEKRPYPPSRRKF